MASAENLIYQDIHRLTSHPGQGNLRITRLPLSLTRRQGCEAVWDVLRTADVDWKISGLEWVNLRRGGANLRVMGADSAVKRVLKTWVALQRARIKWETSAPPVARTSPSPSASVTARGNIGTARKFRLASWNINSLEAKRLEVRDAIHSMKLSVCAFQETLTKDGDWPFTISGYNVFQRHFNDRIPGARGLAVAVTKGLASHIEDCTDHWMLIRIQGIEPDHTWHILNVYIPHDRETKSRVITELRQRVQRLQNNNQLLRLVVLGDLNCRMSRAQTLLGQAGVQRVRVSGSNKTFHRGGRWTGIDHILASPEAMNLLTAARVKRKYEASDHFPIVVKMRLGYNPRHSQQGQQPKKRVDCSAIKDHVQDIVNDVLWERWWSSQLSSSGIGEGDSTEWVEQAATRWDRTSWQVTERHDSVSQPKPWKYKQLGNQVKRAIAVKRDAWLRYCRARPEDQVALLREYRTKRRQAKLVLKEYSRLQWVKHVIKGTHMLSIGSVRNFFKWVDTTTKYRRRQDIAVHPIADDNGQLHYDPDKIAELWAQHYERLFSGTEENNRGIEYWDTTGGLPCSSALDINQDLTWREVQDILRSLKNYKAPGMSGLPAEWFKLLLDEPDDDGYTPEDPPSPMAKVFFLLLSRMWSCSHVPKRWELAELVSIGKKGDLTQRTNYRGISLIETLVKIMVKLVARRVSTKLEDSKWFAVEQAGFRTREECMGQTVALLETLHRRAVQGKGTALMFIDFKKAYDMVDHDALMYKLKCSGVTGKAWDFLRATYASSAVQVRVGDTRSRVIKLRRGCRQGCPGSPPFFDVFINDLALELRETGVGVPGVDHDMGSLLFADDLAVLCETAEAVKRACVIMTAWSRKWGMDIGIDKCGLMVVNSEILKGEIESVHQECTLMGSRIPWVDKYEYLGITVDSNTLPGVPSHIGLRRHAFEKCWQRLSPFLRTHSIPIQARRHAFILVCLPVLRWGTEVMGSAKSSTEDLARIYHEAIKSMVGSRSKNTVLAILPVRRELGLLSFQHMVTRSRARAFTKFPTLNTWPAVLMENPFVSRKAGWIKSSVEWLKKYPKANPWTEDRATIHDKLGVYFRSVEEASSEGKTKAFRQYKECRFEDTREYIKSSLFHPRCSLGVIWLLRARVQGIWTAKRAAKLNLIGAEWAGYCPACTEVINQDELVHVMLLCPQYTEERRILGLGMSAVLDAAVDPKEKVILLLGGKPPEDEAEEPFPHPWTDAQWSGKDGECWGETELPVFLQVAKFLQSVMPRHMASLWALKEDGQ